MNKHMPPVTQAGVRSGAGPVLLLCAVALAGSASLDSVTLDIFPKDTVPVQNKPDSCPYPNSLSRTTNHPRYCKMSIACPGLPQVLWNMGLFTRETCGAGLLMYKGVHFGYQEMNVLGLVVLPRTHLPFLLPPFLPASTDTAETGQGCRGSCMHTGKSSCIR